MPLTWVGTSVVPSPYQGSRTGKQPEPFPQTGQRSKSYSWKKTNAKQERLLQHSHVWIKKKCKNRCEEPKNTQVDEESPSKEVSRYSNSSDIRQWCSSENRTLHCLFSEQLAAVFFAGINLLLNQRKSFKGNSLQADSYSNITLVCVPDLQMLPAEHSIMGRGHTA